MAANLQPITSDGGFTSGGNININNGSDIIAAINEDLEIIVQDEEDDGWALKQTITDSIGNNLSQTTLDRSSFLIELGSDQWQFDGNTLQVTTDSTVRGFNANVVTQALVSGGNPVASLQVVNGVNDPNIFSTFDATSTGANIKVYNGGSNGGVEHAWQFGNTGNLTLPNSATIIAPNVNDLTLRVTGQYNICTLLTGGSGYGGGGSSSAISGGTGTGMIVGYGYGLSGQVTNVGVTDPGTGYSEGDVLTMTAGNGGATFVITKYNTAANAGNNNTAPTDWTFGVDGNITLPNNYSSINYANGSPYGGGGGNTGNVTFDDVTIQGVNQLNLSWDPLATANLSYLQVRGGDVASHIHLDTGNNEAYDLIVGDDAKFVQVSSTGDIIMSSYDGNTSYTWTLDTTGNLILAGGESVIQSVANSSLDPINPNVSTMILTPSVGYSSQSLVLDPTAPGHIHLRAPSSNIDEPLANIFLGGEDSSFEVGYYNGAVPNVFIHSNNNTWTFDTAGNLTTPSNLVIGPGTGSGSRIFQYDEGLEIVGEGANSVVLMGWTANTSAPDSVATIAMNYPSGGEGNILIAVGNNATTVNYWLFDNTGNTTFPRDTGPNTTDPILTIVGGANPSITSTDASLAGPANLGISALTTTFTGFTGDAIKIYPDDGEISSTANLQIWANSGGNTEYSWTFDNAGTLTLPQGSQISETANTSVNITANANTWAFGVNGTLTLPGNTFAVNYANGTQVPVGVTQDISSNGAMSIMLYDGNIKYNNYATVEPSTGNIAGGNISTTGVVTANIANITTGNITTINSGLLQNGNSNITLTANGNVSIQAAGSNVELVVTSTGANVTGTLSATGNITGSYLISAQASGDEGGEISLAKPPNGTLSGGITIDAYQNTLRFFEQGGTARGLSIDIANSPAGGGTAIGYRDIPQVAAGNVTLAATDAGKHYYSTTAGNLTLTIPLNSSVPFTTGTAISIVVQAAGNVLVNAASGVTLYMAGNSTAANRVVGGYGMATLLKVATDTWFINGTGVS